VASPEPSPEASGSNSSSSNTTAEDTSMPFTRPAAEAEQPGAAGPVQGSGTEAGAGGSAAAELSASQEATRALQKECKCIQPHA
jgi:hypothetical protein